uniref:Uncharacterized protein n=1 Tax=Glossina austeni TaxID=7395 RepID=A0A1A9UI40_GLOAU
MAANAAILELLSLLSSVFIEYCTQFHLIQSKLALAYIPNSVQKWYNPVKGDRNPRCDIVDVVFGSDDSDVMLSGFDCILPLRLVRDIFIALQMISLASLVHTLMRATVDVLNTNGNDCNENNHNRDNDAGAIKGIVIVSEFERMRVLREKH